MPPKHAFVAYIDESGDEGFRLARGGSSEWFVLSAAVFRSATEPEAVKLVDNVRAQIGTAAGKPLHWSSLKHERRVAYADHLARAPLRSISVLAHKPSLVSSTLPERNRLYFFCCRLLIERISWMCRERERPGDGCGVQLVFSHRSVTPYAELKNYLKRLQADRSGGVKIHWPAVNIEATCALGHEQRRGLQVADALAGAFFAAASIGAYGHNECRYARMLRPIVYHRGDNYLSYGLKFVPNLSGMIATEPRLAWVRECYK